ncbi:predicted protein [Plenodomus lingam JN3]|uniref:Predicted protein n=1 Tax=Leptosphaeria maculans (strain JN3 / isolate v23.1.3 / race Av1-4-5-6-7-8) TaxID=985895 RepID=E4ZMR4_LEPMJ|nr:predicted protein [Plenodomus lingam JN3]CBX92517.1 predicted protein [Plenodomus lingam JN3]
MPIDPQKIGHVAFAIESLTAMTLHANTSVTHTRLARWIMRSIERGSAGPCVGSPVALIQSQRRYEAGLSTKVVFQRHRAESLSLVRDRGHYEDSLWKRGDYAAFHNEPTLQMPTCTVTIEPCTGLPMVCGTRTSWHYAAILHAASVRKPNPRQAETMASLNVGAV